MPRTKVAAGLLLFRRRHGSATDLEVFLVHPGGPLFASKDEGAWTIPKGEIEPGDDLLPTAIREFEEETGQAVTACAVRPHYHPLGSITQKGGKVVHGWAVEGDWPPHASVTSNTFTMEWPPRSGKQREFPEVDRGQFFTIAEARKKLKAAQEPFLDRLEALLRELGATD